MINASIITIGDELLIGQVIDTNSSWIAQQMNIAGISIKRRLAVGDAWDDIWNALDQEKKDVEVIFITGGLGPTSDDITKPLLCKYFNGKLIFDEDALKNVKFLFEQVFKRPMIESNLKQAEVPDVCTVIQNKRGTAPGMWFEKDGKIFISMPGVPHEMKGMIEEVIPILKDRFSLPVIIHRTLLTSGVGESFLAETLKTFEAELPTTIKLAYLPAYGMVRLRLSSTGMNKDEVESEVSANFSTLVNLVQEHLVTKEDEPMEQVVGKLLMKENKTMATAESCTGGYIAHLITSHAGASKYFIGAVVSYDNDIKSQVLSVQPSTISNNGAVSEETVKEMLGGILLKMKTDYGIAVSGIMGPEGGTNEKPVGTVWIAAGSKEVVQTQKINLRFDRMKNIQVTATIALDLLRTTILRQGSAS